MNAPSIKIERDVWEALERVAGEQHEDPSVIANAALRDWLAEASQIASAVHAGIADAEAGRVVDHSEVQGWLLTWGSPGERARPR